MIKYGRNYFRYYINGEQSVRTMYAKDSSSAYYQIIHRHGANVEIRSLENAGRTKEIIAD